MNATKILTSISATEPCTLPEVWRGMGSEAPERDDKSAYREFFEALNALERLKYVDIEYAGGKVDTLILTSLGADRAREALRESHGM